MRLALEVNKISTGTFTFPLLHDLIDNQKIHFLTLGTIYLCLVSQTSVSIISRHKSLQHTMWLPLKMILERNLCQAPSTQGRAVDDSYQADGNSFLLRKNCIFDDYDAMMGFGRSGKLLLLISYNSQLLRWAYVVRKPEIAPCRDLSILLTPIFLRYTL